MSTPVRVGGTNASAYSVSYTPVSPGSDLVITVFGYNASSLSSVEDSQGQSVLTDFVFTEIYGSPAVMYAGVYRIHGVLAGSHIITLNTRGGWNTVYIFIDEVTNILGVDIGAGSITATTGDSGTLTTSSVTPTAANDYLHAVLETHAASVTFSPYTNGFTQDQAVTTGISVATAYLVDSTSGVAVDAGATLSSSTYWAALLIPYLYGTTPIVDTVNGSLLMPTQNALSTSTTGGTLSAGAYFYRVSATNSTGESLASGEETITTTGSTSSNTVSWGAVTGADGYRIYRGPHAGQEQVYYTVGSVTSFVDTGGTATNGYPPTQNTTAPVPEGSTAVPVTGTNFASGMTAAVVQPNATVSVPFTYLSATTGTFDITQADAEPATGPQLAYTDATYTTGLQLTTAGVTGQPFPLIYTPPTGVLFQTITTPNPNAPNRIETIPDLAGGDQIAFAGDSSGTTAPPDGTALYSDGSFAATQNFWARAYIAADAAWTPWALITVSPEQPGQGFFGGGGV